MSDLPIELIRNNKIVYFRNEKWQYNYSLYAQFWIYFIGSSIHLFLTLEYSLKRHLLPGSSSPDRKELYLIFHHLSKFNFFSAPVRAVDEVLLGEVDISLQEKSLEITTEKAFLKKCIVDGKTYSHSQTVR